MELTAATAEMYVRWAFTQILDIVDRLDDSLVNERPPGPETNTVAAIVTHCCGVCEFWLGHVGVGRPSTRDRDAEFTATASVAELHALVDATLVQLCDDLRSIDAGEASAHFHAGRQFLSVEDESDAALVIHVIEELFQHLGQIELTADALIA